MPDDIKVTKQTEEAAFEQGGKMTLQVRVTFYDGDHGPFSIALPKEGFTGYGARAAIDAYVRELRTARGV